MAKEYIERESMLEEITAIMFGKPDIDLAQAAVKYAPAADVVEVRHGEWKKATEPCGLVDCVVCSACGESWILDGDIDFDVVKDFWNYCLNCGAKMDGERKEQT